MDEIMTLVDTNIIVRYLVGDGGDMADEARELIEGGLAYTYPEVLAEAVDIMQRSGSIDYARAYAENLTSIAKNHLMMVLPASPARDMLASMADWFVNRLN